DRRRAVPAERRTEPAPAPHRAGRRPRLRPRHAAVALPRAERPDRSMGGDPRLRLRTLRPPSARRRPARRAGHPAGRGPARPPRSRCLGRDEERPGRRRSAGRRSGRPGRGPPDLGAGGRRVLRAGRAGNGGRTAARDRAAHRRHDAEARLRRPAPPPSRPVPAAGAHDAMAAPPPSARGRQRRRGGHPPRAARQLSVVRRPGASAGRGRRAPDPAAAARRPALADRRPAAARRRRPGSGRGPARVAAGL
ncbi:MAG: hypothetical protein AVDCRST_MAG57-2570, partial [uncultured Blastococcus sp.]